MEWMIVPLKRYAQFRGRSRRMEYWMFAVFNLLLGIVAGLADTLLGFGEMTRTSSAGAYSAQWASDGPLGALVTLALFVPNLAVSVRRLHDTDRSGWWLLLVLLPILGWIALFVFFCTDGTRGPNRFGPDPKDPNGHLDAAEVFG